ncbi:hypothetical protein SANBI_002705 [Sanguibacter sp. 4.1]|uniref:Uncharacterized protein n=1 Tax=Sanguibacter biliveldensis TaxID=3030830 RepID=A0AAF0Z6R0_9MICO|nr:hypothetical protein [Sanguibacter sp. 4.1]WPF81411.1 hypothetical protein SANBI_002705 [Sanguibacter sp. 4.1]
MTMPYKMPSAVFSGAFGDNATGQYFPARAEVSDGFVTLWIASPTGWTQYFRVPAQEVVVKSAAQRITLAVHGQSYPILADPRSVDRAIGHGIAGGVADILDKPRFEMGVDLARTVNVAGAAYSFHLGGGPGFIAAAQQSGARTSRLGYGPILALGCGGGVLVVVVVTLVTLLAISL